MTRLAVVIPARNEAERLPQVVRALPKRLPGMAEVNVLVVDDGSSDGTGAAARAAGARVLRHRVNLGKGGALKTGCEAAIAAGDDLIAEMDADGQQRAADLERLVEPLVSGAADLVVTYRSFAGDMPAPMRLGNWGLSGFFSVLYGQRFRDTQCGMRAFTAAAYPKLRWESAGYAVETEMLVHAARAHLRVAEIPIETVYLDAYKGTTPADGIRIAVDMLRWMVDR